MVSMAPLLELFPAQGEWSESDYFPLSERGRLVELSDGNIEVLPLPTYVHQQILLRLAFALHAFVLARDLGHICFAPLPVRLWPGKIREPDLMFMATAHADRIGKYWGVPDLAVEILSEGTENQDRRVKRAEYARAGILEYWIIDPVAMSIDLLLLRGSGYDVSAVLTGNDNLTSPMFPGFALPLREIFDPQQG